MRSPLISKSAIALKLQKCDRPLHPKSAIALYAHKCDRPYLPKKNHYPKMS
ncbi:hypothetical protein QT970_08860 [Microcoleus sp. herbarium8]|uniref:hypothetical protein n=1 Tax=Microcoleus sp. herbarium8 TaxID=3055436 RepID=UPI002FCF7D88